MFCTNIVLIVLNSTDKYIKHYNVVSALKLTLVFSNLLKCRLQYNFNEHYYGQTAFYLKVNSFNLK